MKCPSCHLNYEYESVSGDHPFGYLNKYEDLFKKIDCRDCGTIYKASFISKFLFIGGIAFALYLILFTNFKPLSVFGLKGGVVFFSHLVLFLPLSLIPFFVYYHLIKGTGRSLNQWKEKKNEEAEARRLDVLKKNAHNYFDKGDWKGSINCFLGYLEVKPNDYHSRYSLGDAYYYKNKYEEAIINYLKVLDGKTNLNKDCYKMLAYSYYFNNEKSIAWDYHRKAMKANPELKYNTDFQNKFKGEIVNCPRCKNQYDFYDLLGTKMKLMATCPHCGWKREFIDKKKTKPGFLFYIFGIITILWFMIIWVDYPNFVVPKVITTFISAAITLYFMQANHVKLVGETFDGQAGQNYPKNSYPEEETVEQIGFGSGFLLSKQGIIITNYHVIKQAKDIKIHFPTLGTDIDARVITQDKENDIAILDIDIWIDEDDVNIPFQKANESIRSGQNVHTIGYPLVNIMGEKPRLTSGVISSPYGIQDDPRYFQITTPIQPGNSGGIVFTDNGEAVGIIVSSINDEMIMNATGTIAQNINFALKFDYVEVLLKSENLETEYSKANYRNLLLEDLVDLVEPTTCQIIVKQELIS